MTPLLTVAQSTTFDLTPESARLSPLLWKGFTAVNQIHGFWRWYRRYELYSKPDTLAQMLAGHALQMALGDVVILRIAAQCLLIATRIMECAKQQSVLSNSLNKWWTVGIQGNYSKPIKRKWVSNLNSHWVSPSSSGWLQSGLLAFWNRLLRIMECTAKVFFHSFKLSMLLMDTVDVFNLSPHTQNEGITKLFVNTVKCLNTLTENKEELLSGIETNRAIIEKILANSPITYERLHSTIEQALEKTEILHDTAKTVSAAGGGFLEYALHRVVTGGRVFIGA